VRGGVLASVYPARHEVADPDDPRLWGSHAQRCSLRDQARSGRKRAGGLPRALLQRFYVSGRQDLNLRPPGPTCKMGVSRGVSVSLRAAAGEDQRQARQGSPAAVWFLRADRGRPNVEGTAAFRPMRKRALPGGLVAKWLKYQPFSDESTVRARTNGDRRTDCQSDQARAHERDPWAPVGAPVRS
jgi:hypothetical protein